MNECCGWKVEAGPGIPVSWLMSITLSLDIVENVSEVSILFVFERELLTAALSAAEVADVLDETLICSSLARSRMSSLGDFHRTICMQGFLLWTENKKSLDISSYHKIHGISIFS